MKRHNCLILSELGTAITRGMQSILMDNAAYHPGENDDRDTIFNPFDSLRCSRLGEHGYGKHFRTIWYGVWCFRALFPGTYLLIRGQFSLLLLGLLSSESQEMESSESDKRLVELVRRLTCQRLGHSRVRSVSMRLRI